MHFSTLVEGTYLLLGEGITSDDLARSDLLLKAFVKSAEDLYGKQFMGLNVHSLLHLTSCVKKWGPLWAWSCFCFESFNGEIKKSIHGTGNVCRQIFWSLHAEKYFENNDLSKCAINIQDYLNGLVSDKLVSEKNAIHAHQCTILHAKDIKQEPQAYNFIKDTLEQFAGTKAITDFSLASKIIRNGFIMYSKLCTKVKKRNSYSIRLNEENGYIEVEYYLLHKLSSRAFAIGRRLIEVGPMLPNRVPHIHEVKLDRNFMVQPVEQLLDVMVTVNVGRKIYVSLMPNLIERN